MTLINKQARFTECVALLLNFAFKEGFQVSFGDAYRSPLVSYGHPKSCHRSRLAIDLNFFKNGVWLRETEQLEQLGVFWESLDIMASWGGRFNDGNHFSFEHNGIR